MTRLLITAASALALLVGIAAIAPVEAASARCGMTVRGKVKLTQDLRCRETRPIRLIGQKAHLDLNGFTISCGDSSDLTEDPILMLGRGALLRNGSLSECTVKLLDRGGHKIRGVHVYTFNHLALLIASDSNEVVYSSFGADDHAAHIEKGNYNLISDSSMGADVTGLSVSGNRTVIVNSHFGIIPDGDFALSISGNLNRVYGNSTLEGCIWIHPDSVGNIADPNREDPDWCPEPN